MNIKTQRRQRKTGRRGPKYWIVAVGTMGVLVAFSTGKSHAVNLGKLRANSSEYSQNQRAIKLDIPAGTIESVLTLFQKASGLQVVIPNEAMKVIASPGISGTFTTEQALREILKGTGITYRFSDTRTVILEIVAATENVEVRDDSKVQVASPKYTEPLLNTPQTINVISKEVIEEQGATTLRDVLRNVPGITITAGEGGNPAGDNLTLRGFSARNDIFVDGVRDISPQSRDPFNLEEVDVVKGPGSAYTGRGSAGGSINLLNKTPNLRRSFGGTLEFGTDRLARGTADINVPLNDTIAFRLNLLGHHSGVAGRDVVKNDRWGFAPSITFGLGKPTRLTASFYKLNQDNISDYGIPWVPVTNNALVAYRDKPAPVPRNTFYGLRDRDFEKLDTNLVTLKFEHDFNDSLSLRNQFRFARSSRDSIATPPRFTTNLNSTAINRELRSWQTDDDIWDNQSDFTARFSTGEVEHAFVGGVALTRETNVRHTRTAGNMATTLLNPNPDDVFTLPIVESPIVGDITANSQAFYLFDTLKFGQRWELSGGLRWDRFDADGVSTTGASVSRIDRMLSGRAGLVFHPVQQGTLYVSYGTALNPSLEGLSYNTANTVIDPEKTHTIEAGTKWDFFQGRMMVTGAVFRVDKTNARTPGVGNEPAQVLEGEQRVDGVELGVTGTLTKGWQVLAGYTYLDSETVDSRTIGEIGKDLVNTPRNSFNLWSTYRFANGFHFGGGVRFVGERFGNTINTRWVNSYWTADLMAAYPISSQLDLKLNLYNLTNTYYFDRLGGGHVVPGPGRSASFGLGFRF